MHEFVSLVCVCVLLVAYKMFVGAVVVFIVVVAVDSVIRC